MCRILVITFVFMTAASGVSRPLFAENNAGKYKAPADLTASKDGKTVYIANTDAGEIACLNTENDSITAIRLPISPNGIRLSADEKTLYVTGGGADGKLSALDLTQGKVVKTAAAGHTPMGMTLSADGKKLFVCNRFNNNVGEYDLPDLKLVKTYKVTREPRAAVATKDGQYLLVANSIPLNPGNDPANPDAAIYVAAEVSVINLADGSVKPIKLPNGSGSLHGMCMSPDGRYVYVTEILARFPLPTTAVERGWMNTAGIAIIDTAKLDSTEDAFLNAVLLDDVDQGAGNPWGIAVSPDGKRIYAAIAGTGELVAIDAESMHKKLEIIRESQTKEKTSAGQIISVETSNDFTVLVGLKKRLRLEGKGARAVAVAGNHIYTGMYYSDTIVKTEADTSKPVENIFGKRTEIALGPKPVWTPERRGEIWWNDASLCFQQWQSCASCHPDARMDGYNWDLLNDGLGNPKNAKSLILSMQTTPSMWESVRDNPELDKRLKRKEWHTDSMGLQCIRTGFQFILFAMPDEEKCKDIDAYLRAEKPVPSPFLVNGKLSEKAERGKKIFEDPKIGCAKCHPAPLFTDRKMHDVNTKCYYDRTSEFDTPTLVEVWRTAPYLHDGRYTTLKELFKPGMHGDVEGAVGDLTDQQIDDLVEYIRSL
ncbi:MAG: beta-propeller fold lactonase family protein [Planctomycetaceae bacterium]|jgi:DNA-binding beta-propeller fold protein YncE|nr:beta-propeller fold lactonase family protein [Planctomycetaceae bacterium]